MLLCVLHICLQWYSKEIVLKEVIIAHNLAGISTRLDGTGEARTVGGTFLYRMRTMSSKEAKDYIFKGITPEMA